MQGSYKNNGLPRPYYMKPQRRGVYDKMPRRFFYSNLRRVLGYLILLCLFGLCIYMFLQDLRPEPDTDYELLSAQDVKLGDVGKLVDLAKGEDKASEKAGLKENVAQNSRGEVGHGVVEAPKGGMVNEAPIVGTDEGLVIDGKTKKGTQARADRNPQNAGVV